jgi:tetratricopeptide (TPR) repeat protein
MELENLLAAIGWCREAPEGAVNGLRLVHAIRNYWDSRGLNDLGARVTREALARDVGDGFVTERLKLRVALTSMLQRRGLIAESLEVAEGTLALAKEVGDPTRIAVAHRALGIGLYMVGRVSEARGELEEAIRILRSQDDTKRLGITLGSLGEIQRLEGRNVEALQTYEEALALLRRTGDPDTTAIMLVNLAMVAMDAGRVGPARDYLRECTHTAEKISGKYIGTAAVGTAGALAAICGDGARAARFWGAAAEARDRMGVILDPPDVKFLEPHVERVRAELGPAAFAAAERQGRAVPYESALAEARRWVEEG